MSRAEVIARVHNAEERRYRRWAVQTDAIDLRIPDGSRAFMRTSQLAGDSSYVALLEELAHQANDAIELLGAIHAMVESIEALAGERGARLT